MSEVIKVVIYGIGVDQMFLETLLLDNVQIVAYTDSFAQIEWYNGKRFVRPDSLWEVTFDYIIVAIRDEDVREKIVRNLIKNYCKFDKIVDLWRVPKVDRVMLNTKEPWEGMVLGISYGDAGIEPKYFSKRFCNLALPSQDLCENYLTLKKCIEEYSKKLDLKYFILDMFDYDYFNFDISLSRNIRRHLLHQGG